MTTEDMTEMLKSLHADELALRQTKASEYTKGNAFENFKVGGRRLDLSPSACAWAYLMKHLVSIEMHICGSKKLNQEQLKEKIQDARLYLALIYGMEVTE